MTGIFWVKSSPVKSPGNAGSAEGAVGPATQAADEDEAVEDEAAQGAAAGAAGAAVGGAAGHSDTGTPCSPCINVEAATMPAAAAAAA